MSDCEGIRLQPSTALKFTRANKLYSR